MTTKYFVFVSSVMDESSDDRRIGSLVPKILCRFSVEVISNVVNIVNECVTRINNTRSVVRLLKRI